MLRKIGFQLAVVCSCSAPWHSYATLNETVQLSLNPDGNAYSLISVDDNRILLSLSQYDNESFTEQVRLLSVDQNYQITELYQYPEAFDSEVGVSFLNVGDIIYSVAWEGIYQFDINALSGQKITLPELITPTETMEAYNYDYYFQSNPGMTEKHLYVYEMAVWDENSLATLAKISRFENGEFVDYIIDGFSQGVRTTQPFENKLGLVFRDEQNWYVLSDEKEMRSFPHNDFAASFNYATLENVIVYPSGTSELMWIHQTQQGTLEQDVLLDLSSHNETFLGYLIADNAIAFATDDQEGKYRVHLVTENGLLPALEIEKPESESPIDRIYLHKDGAFGFIRIDDSILLFDATTGEILEPERGFEDISSNEYAYSFGDAILVIEKTSTVPVSLSKATFIDNNLNLTDATAQIASDIAPECLYFSYFGDNGFLNNKVVSNCPAEGHYVVGDDLNLVSTPPTTDRGIWRFSRDFFVFNNLRHSIAGTFADELNLVSWHGSSDFDLDGVPDTDDAFPEDLSESTDTDGDGIGNNADQDDDNDGIDDINDPQPLVPNVEQPIPEVPNSNSSSGGSLNLFLLAVLLVTSLSRRMMSARQHGVQVGNEPY